MAESSDKVRVRTDRGKGRPPRLVTDFTPAQEKIAKCDKRFIFVCAGRRFGKTTFSKSWIHRKAAHTSHQNVWYVAPTQKMAKALMWDNLISYFLKTDIVKESATACDILLRNGSKIGLRGSDRPDNLRGVGLDNVVMEEYSFHKRGVWDLITRPQLADRRGGALFIGTPSMKHGPHYRQLHDYAKSGKDPDWAYFHFTIYDNPHVSPDEIKMLKDSVPEFAWKQEYMAEFLDEEGTVYFEFNPVKSVYRPSEQFKFIEMKGDTYCGIDWGLEANTACVWVHILDDGRIVVSDEHVQNNWVADRQATAIKEKNKSYRNIKVSVLDETAFKREGTSGESVGRKFQRGGISVQPACVRNVGDGIDIIKKFLQGDDNGPWLFVSEKCKTIIAGLNEWQYGDHEPDSLSALRFIMMFIRNHNLSPLCSRIPVKSVEKKVELPPEPYVHRISVDAPTRGFQWDFDHGGWA